MDWWNNPEIARTAAGVAKRFREYVDVEDVKSVLVLWCLENPSTAEKAANGPPWFWHRRLWTVGQRFARDEKAQIVGHEVEDEFFYSPFLVRQLLPDAFDGDAVKPNGGAGEVKIKNTNVNGGADWETMIADLRRGLQLMSQADFDLLFALYSDQKTTLTAYCASKGWDYRTGIKKERRAMGRLIDLLGGVTPWVEDITQPPREGPPDGRTATNTVGATHG